MTTITLYKKEGRLIKGSRLKKEEELLVQVLNTIKKYNLIENGDRIVLGVSGGPDSICLLSILNKIKNDSSIKLDFDIFVAHVNHMIRKEAKSDEEFVREFCNNIGVEFFLKSIDIQKIANNNKIGTEEAGRIERYKFFDEILYKTNSNKIAIAHNKNDKVETIIMNVLRGSGISGLKGIQALNGIYIRPLIESERYKIEQYCQINNINPRIDKTNYENIYTRNKTRNVVIPYIQKEYNPNIIETIDRLSQLVVEEEEYFNKVIEEKYKELKLEESEKQIVLNLKLFNKQEKVIKSRLLIYTISRLLGNSNGIEKIHIEDIIKLCANNIGNKYLTPNKNIKILIKTNKIYFIS